MLVTYDVFTGTTEGERRLRKVAKVCEAFGQRVQKSVFELALDRGLVEVFLDRVLSEVKLEEDSLRLYRLREPRDQYLRTFGVVPPFDVRGPLIL